MLDDNTTIDNDGIPIVSHKNFSLEEYKKASKNMIATSEGRYGNSDYWYSGSQRNEKIRKYTKDQAITIIESGSAELQAKMSRDFFNSSGFYKRILAHYATLLKYEGILIPDVTQGKSIQDKNISKNYYKSMNLVENMKLKENLERISLRVLRDGAYYGVIQTLTKDTFGIIDLPFKYCRSNFRDELGNDIVEFDVSYFDTISDKKERKIILDTYPREISSYYRRYDKSKKLKRWLVLSIETGFCFNLFNSRPQFLTVIPSILDYDDTIERDVARQAEEIKKIVVQKVPHLTTGELLFEPDEADEMHSAASGMLKNKNPNTSVLTTYCDVDAIVSNQSNESTSDNVERSKKGIFNESGTSADIFSASGNLALETSLKNDLSLMMSLANKYSRFITNLLNRMHGNGNIKFKYQILPITYFNESDYINNASKMSTSGYSFLLPAIAQGFSQRDLINIKDLENDVLNLGEKLIPLQTSFTQSQNAGSGGVGRPALSNDQKSDKTLANERSMENTGDGGTTDE